MSPYQTRNRILSTTDSKEVQAKRKSAGSKITFENTSVITKAVKIKDNSKVINTRSKIRSIHTSSKKSKNGNSTVKDVPQNEKEEEIKHKRLSKGDNVTKKKSKKNELHTNAMVNKQGVSNKDAKPGRKNDNHISCSRQMSLKESFLNQTKMKPCIDKSSAAKKTSSVNKKKQPIYKCPSFENSKENTNEIYDFKFDINDSKERLPKKRKKGIGLKRKIRNKKGYMQRAKVCKEKSSTLKTKKVNEVEHVEPKESNNTPISKVQSDNNANEFSMNNSGKDMETKKNVVSESSTVVEQATLYNSVRRTPTIISADDISHKRITIIDASKISSADSFRPFRPTNIFNNKLTIQQCTALNNSLFEKSLSPIGQLIEVPQIDSPCRLPSLQTFSQVKNAYQSTPLNAKCDSPRKRFSHTLNNVFKQNGSVKRIKSTFHKNNENISGRLTLDTPKSKNTSAVRKFGTEITNLNHSLQSNIVEQNSVRTASDIENDESNGQSHMFNAPNVNNVIKFKDEKAECNSVSNAEKAPLPEEYTSSRGIKIDAPQQEMKTETVQKCKNLIDAQKENFYPQPGPSGLQNKLLCNEERVLRQTNLNSYLNIMDMPESTLIKTHHGIFDDSKSIPVNSRSVKKTNNSNLDLQNAFGFANDNSDEDMPVAETKIINKKENNPNEASSEVQYKTQPIRLSAGEIKCKLLSEKLKSNKYNEENALVTKMDHKESLIQRKNKQKIDIANFSDTFDILSEGGDDSVVSQTEIPLFADCEPIHFTQPPRFSYKRKRAVQFNFSDAESDQEQERVQEHEQKKKKVNKIKQEREKRLMEWVQDTNRRFNEIEQHDLLIE